MTAASVLDELAAPNVRKLVDPRTMPVRFRHLMAMGRSPLHCLTAFQEPDRNETLSMKLGSGTHAMVGGKPVAVYPGPVRRGKQYDAFKATHPHAVILTAKEHAKAQAMNLAIRSHDEASALLFGPGVIREQELRWEFNGRKCVSTPDAFGPYGVVELKTTRCSQPNRFVRDAIWNGYVAQVCWYGQAVFRSTRASPVQSAYIIAVESAPPHAVTVLKLTERALERGEAQWRGWWERLMVCEQSGSWPAYSQCIVDLDYPDDDIGLTFADDDAEEGDGE